MWSGDTFLLPLPQQLLSLGHWWTVTSKWLGDTFLLSLPQQLLSLGHWGTAISRWSGDTILLPIPRQLLSLGRWGDSHLQVVRRYVPTSTPPADVIKAPNLGNMSHKSPKQWEKWNGELGTNLAAMLSPWLWWQNNGKKAHWNASMCQNQHSHWDTIKPRNPNALWKACWMLCIFCSWSYRGACFQFGHQSAYFDTLEYFTNAIVPMHFERDTW